MAIKGRDGNLLHLQGPNPLLIRQSNRTVGWERGERSGFHCLGDLYVDVGTAPVARPRRQQQTYVEDIATEATAEMHTPEMLVEENDDMIKNPNGTPYQLGEVDHFAPENPDHRLMDQIDQEHIQIAGAPIEYYRVLVDSNVDQLYMEQRQKITLQRPVRMKAIWEPVPPAWNDIGAGWSSEESMAFSFNREEFINLVKEWPRIGSLIKTCDEGIFWEITNNQVNVPNEDRKIWGKHRIVVTCSKHQGTITDYSPSHLGRESAERGKKPINIM